MQSLLITPSVAAPITFQTNTAYISTRFIPQHFHTPSISNVTLQQPSVPVTLASHFSHPPNTHSNYHHSQPPPQHIQSNTSNRPGANVRRYNNASTNLISLSNGPPNSSRRSYYQNSSSSTSSNSSNSSTSSNTNNNNHRNGPSVNDSRSAANNKIYNGYSKSSGRNSNLFQNDNSQVQRKTHVYNSNNVILSNNQLVEKFTS